MISDVEMFLVNLFLIRERILPSVFVTYYFRFDKPLVREKITFDLFLLAVFRNKILDTVHTNTGASLSNSLVFYQIEHKHDTIS
jgi:hypothetical protein